jgi:hypothetical protein
VNRLPPACGHEQLTGAAGHLIWGMLSCACTFGVPDGLLLAARRQGILPTRQALSISIRKQKLVHLLLDRRARTYVPAGEYLVSTSRFGPGQAEGSNRTPLGLHRIAEKIGGGWPPGTVFKNRRVAGFVWDGFPAAKITTRILWLEGLEAGVNLGGGVDSHRRYIYIHGTGDEPSLGRPASCGCIHLASDDLVPLFDRVPSGTLVWIGH